MEDYHKNYGETVKVAGISFRVEAGEILTAATHGHEGGVAVRVAARAFRQERRLDRAGGSIGK